LGIEDFVGNVSEHRMAANEQSVFLPGKECQHQLCFVTWDEDCAVVVVILNVAFQFGEAILFGK
jgi:hypothetical protein